MFRWILGKLPNLKSHENPFSRCRVVFCGQTDWHTSFDVTSKIISDLAVAAAKSYQQLFLWAHNKDLIYGQFFIFISIPLWVGLYPYRLLILEHYVIKIPDLESTRFVPATLITYTVVVDTSLRFAKFLSQYTFSESSGKDKLFRYKSYFIQHDDFHVSD